MGVQGLWHLLEPTGRPVSLESLEGKILAVDISIWLNQLVKGMRDHHGNQVANAHLVGLFTRICKLLFYRIKPVFVFDGGVPALKKHTLAQRRQQKEEAKMASTKTNRKLLDAVLKRQAVGAALGTASRTTTTGTKNDQGNNASDIFDLPPMPTEEPVIMEDVSGQTPVNLPEETDGYEDFYDLFDDPADIDVDSEDFKTLPPEIQLELITDLRESRKRHTLKDLHHLPENSDDFSNYQMAKLLKQNHLSSKLNDVRKQLVLQETGELAQNLTDNQSWDMSVQTQRLASTDTSRYILIKGLRNPEEQLANHITGVTENSTNQDAEDMREHRHAHREDGDIAPNRNIPKAGTQQNSVNDIVNLSSSDDDDEPSIVKMKKSHEVTPTMCDNEGNLVETEEKNKKHTSQFEDNLACGEVSVSVDSVGNKLKDSVVVDLDVCESKLNPEGKLHKKTDEIQEQNQTHENDAFVPPSAKKLKMDVRETGESHPEESHHGESHPEESLKASEPIVEVSDAEADESDDEFIEIVIDPKTCQPDDELFPASIFTRSKSPIEGIPEGGISHGGIPSEGIPSEGSHSEKPGQSVARTDIPPLPEANRDILDFQDEIPPPAENEFSGITKTELLDLQSALEEETKQLQSQRGQEERVGASITDQMYAEAQDLLSLFGLPFIVSPTEAEAQCAFLDLTDQTHGSITDDSDIWLFGGRRVYKNFFNKNKDVEFFSFTDINSQLLLDRDKMIQMALLCGSDYTEGIQGVGPVTAMEILEEFRGSGQPPLQNLRTWWDKIQLERKVPTESKLRTKLRKLEIKEGFPNQSVIDAYLHPTLDESTEAFSWSKPDLDLLREFAETRLGWHKSKSDELLLPVLKKLNQSQTQLHMTKFITHGVEKPRQVKSKRIKNSLARMKTLHRETPHVVESEITVPVKKTKGKTCRGAKSKNSVANIRLDSEAAGGWMPSRSSGITHQVELSESSSESDHGSLSVEFDSDSSVDGILGTMDLHEFEQDSEDLPGY